MIRRVALAVVIAAAALALLRWVIGKDDFASSGVDPSNSPVKVGTGTPPNIVVDTTADGKRNAVGISVDGRFDFTSTVERRMPDGSRIFAKRYVIHADDSATVANDLARLDRVTADVFRIDDGEGEPKSVAVATITARVALVQLGRDAAGQPSIRADRDMDLTDVVLVSAPGSSLRDLRLAIDRVLVRQDEDGVHLRTPDDRMPFTLSFGGEQPMAMSGRGLDGFLPGLRGEGDTRDAQGQLRLDVAHEPVVTRADLTLRARGKLRYLEDLASGDGRISMHDSVVVEGVEAVQGAPGTAKAYGDELEARIQRTSRTADDGSERADPMKPSTARWRAMTLRGQRARLVVQGFELSCDSLVVTPALDGEPALFTAEGTPTLDETAERGLRFRAERRIHVVDVARWIGPLHRAVGFPSPRFGALAQRLFLFEGASHVDDRAHAITVDASEGLSVLRGDAGLDLVRGEGDVRVLGAELELSGNRGFLLTRGPSGERVRLGPAKVDPSHRFHVLERSTAAAPMTLEGEGACTFHRHPDGRVTAKVESPAGTVRIVRGTTTVAAIRTLDAELRDDGRLASLRATGAPCTLDAEFLDEKGRREAARATGTSVESGDGRSLTLFGAPAMVVRANGGRVRGARIDVTPFSGQAPAIVVSGVPAQVDDVRVARSDRGADAATPESESLSLDAERIALVPSLLPPAVLRAHGIPSRSWANPARAQVLANGALDVRRRDVAGNELGSASGDRIWLRPESESALLTGLPAVFRERDASGREFVARAERLRGFRRADGTPYVIVEPNGEALPEIDVHGSGSGSSVRDLRVVASVPIVLDGDRLLVDGEMRLRSMRPDGSVDPEGLDVSAAGVEATLDRTEGTLRTLHARDARLVWRNVRAGGEDLRIDVPRTTIEVEGDSATGAWVELPGQRHRGGLVRFDYESRELRVWGPRAGSSATPRR